MKASQHCDTAGGYPPIEASQERWLRAFFCQFIVFLQYHGSGILDTMEIVENVFRILAIKAVSVECCGVNSSLQTATFLFVG